MSAAWWATFPFAHGVTVENAIGGAGNDLLIGNAAVPTILFGGAGNDIHLRRRRGRHVVGRRRAPTRSCSARPAIRPMTAPDWIMDFTSGLDKIDLSGIAGFRVGRGVAELCQRLHRACGRCDPDVLRDRAIRRRLLVDLTGQGAVDFAVGVVGQAVAS
jgi:serralysin